MLKTGHLASALKSTTIAYQGFHGNWSVGPVLEVRHSVVRESFVEWDIDHGSGPVRELDWKFTVQGPVSANSTNTRTQGDLGEGLADLDAVRVIHAGGTISSQDGSPYRIHHCRIMGGWQISMDLDEAPADAALTVVELLPSGEVDQEHQSGSSVEFGKWRASGLCSPSHVGGRWCRGLGQFVSSVGGRVAFGRRRRGCSRFVAFAFSWSPTSQMVECDAFGADGFDSSFGPAFDWKPLAGSPVGKPGRRNCLGDGPQ